MGTKLTNAPVFYALIQVQFNTLMQLPKFVPEIQERLRIAGFPDFAEEMQAVFQMQSISNESQPQFMNDLAPKWSFMNIHKTEGFVLLRDGLIYHTTEYKDSNVFFDRALQGLNIIHEVVSLALVRRIGIRFLDAVVPNSNESLDQYLSQQVLGLRGISPENSLHSMSESVFNYQDGSVLVSRVMSANVIQSAPLMPNELLPLPLKIKDKFESITSNIAVLDTDSFVIPTQSREFSIETIHSILIALKKNITFAFKKIVTPYALERWL